MKKIIMLNIVLSLIIALVGCNSSTLQDNNVPVVETSVQEVQVEEEKETITEIDYMTKLIEEYEGINEQQNVQVDLPDTFNVKYLDENGIKTFLENGTGIIYFGWNTCPWCRNMLPVLLETLNENQETLYYFNPKEIRGNNSDTYSFIIEKLGNYLKKDENGNPKLFVPEVMAIKNGKVVFHHLGTVDSQKDATIPMTEEQVKELKISYVNGINLIK